MFRLLALTIVGGWVLLAAGCATAPAESRLPTPLTDANRAAFSDGVDHGLYTRGTPTALIKPALPTLPAEYRDALNAREVVVMKQIIDDEEDRSYSEAVEMIRIEAPVDEVFSYVENDAIFSKFMPGLDRVILLDATGDPDTVVAKAWRYEASQFPFTIVYSPITIVDRRSHAVEFFLHPYLDHDLKQADGHWWLYPLENDATLIVYATRVESKVPLPGWLETYVVERGLRDVLRNLRRHIESGGTWTKYD